MAYIPGRKKQDAERRKLIRRLDDIDLEKLKKAYEDLEFVHKQIRESHIEMILNLAIAAEYKDPDTGNHILRISDYATELAIALKLPKDEVDIVRYASPMHDIGKIGIPDNILQKPGKLDAAEWEVMKGHTSIGCRMFANSTSPLLRAVSAIANSHHEKYDGTGYPNGLKGKEIPLYGRIIAIVDVFDAVVSKRCYKTAWSFKEGMDYIKTLAGNHLDPDLVAAFVKIEPRIREIYDANLSIQKYIEDFKETDQKLSDAQGSQG